EIQHLMERVRKDAAEAAEAGERKKTGQMALGGAPMMVGPGGFGGGGVIRGGGIGTMPGTAGGDMDKRLREVERKLDLLIQLMRQGARPGAQGFPGGPGARNNNPFNPPPPTITTGASGVNPSLQDPLL